MSGTSSTSGSQPKQIGQYQIRRLIASGGMGSVYEAVQQNPRRPVALKVINAAVATDEAASRLKYEAQLLARLRHPGIAEIYEAGTYEEGGRQLPFFAMEYIPNARSITAYAREKNLGLREKLELFAEACDAVHHGHQRSIVHRDLKPANILVDSHGRVRVIDFGIARATDADMRQTEVHTEVGQLVGSALYMSPEQFEADPRDIDTRSDVYALGVVLYQLLSGKMPYEAKSGNIYEVALVIKEERPQPLGSTDPECRGDIETIVEKAMQKNRDLRYESAHGLAADLRRYLNGEAIAARPPSLKYQMRVFARRNKPLVASLAALMLLLVAAVSVVSWLYVSVSHERARAEKESRSATAARDFLTEALSAAVPRSYGEVVTVLDILDQAESKLDGAFPDDPQTEAEVRRSLGLAYLNMDLARQSESNLRKALALRTSALGTTDPRTLESMHDLDVIYAEYGNTEELVDLRQGILSACNSSSGPTHESTIEAQLNYASALESHGDLEDALRETGAAVDACRSAHGGESEQTLEAEWQYAWLLMQTGRLKEALELATEDNEKGNRLFPEGDRRRRYGRSMLAAALLANGDVEAAKELYGHRRMPEQLAVEREFQGSFQPNNSNLEILVFWETWCPYSQKAVPKLEQVYRRYHDLGVDVVGLTAVRLSSTDAKVVEFLKDKGISYTVVKETGPAWRYFDVNGTPSIRVMYQGELVWEKYVLSSEPFSDKILDGILHRS